MPNSATSASYADLVERMEAHGQSHVLQFWDELSEDERARLTDQIEAIDFPLVERLVAEWIEGHPEGEEFQKIEPVPIKDIPDPSDPDAKAAAEAGEDALRDGRVGLVLVAGGQGTRLGYPGPKGTFPIGPVTGRTLFEYDADKIRAAQRRYGKTVPWYIMVGETNEAATIAFFEENNYLGLDRDAVRFFKQAMMPSVSEDGKFFLAEKGSLAMNPNGHGGCIPALVDNGILADCADRHIDTLSYFQVDNWAANFIDPYFIGYHVLNNGEMSSKVSRKQEPREKSGVFCICDGKLRVIEYTELDIYPQLLETDENGKLIYYGGNAAIHMISTDFIQRVYDRYDEFPWHCSHKKITHVDRTGKVVEPQEPNGYKFETFVFDALVYARPDQVTLELDLDREYALAKQMSGRGGVDEARAKMNALWRPWLEAAGCTRNLEGVDIEISPDFASTQEEFVKKASGFTWPQSGGIGVLPDGTVVSN